jgi:hypothetical protein
MGHSILHGHGLGRLSQTRLNAQHNQPDTISAFKQIEEETLPNYNANAFYPARINEVLNGRYQIVLKLGFGVTSTVWLARDSHA